MVLYACETWTLTWDKRNTLEALEMWVWRRLLKISWVDHIRNEKVLRTVDEQRCILDAITCRQINWIEHVLRGKTY